MKGLAKYFLAGTETTETEDRSDFSPLSEPAPTEDDADAGLEADFEVDVDEDERPAAGFFDCERKLSELCSETRFDFFLTLTS